MQYGIEYMVVTNLFSIFVLGAIVALRYKKLTMKTIQTLYRIITGMLMLSFATFIILTIWWYWK